LALDAERDRRLSLWQREKATSADELNAKLLRDLRVYGGAQGIWVDRESTSSVSPNIASVTVSILHTGEHYPDDLSDDGVIYHYPETRRSAGRDRSEVDATKAAHDLGLPIFVILNHPSKVELRLVRLAWVADWDDDSKQFLILFGEQPQKLEPIVLADAPFQLHAARERRTTHAQVRVGQQKFRFEVLKQYGAKCCLCSIAVPQLLAAAHICGKEHDGSDD
jgi:putative restriction endonuclease